MSFPYQYPSGLGPFKLFPVSIPPVSFTQTTTDNNEIEFELTLFPLLPSEYLIVDDFIADLTTGETFAIRAPVPDGQSYNGGSLVEGNYYVRNHADDPQLFKFVEGTAQNPTVEPAARADGDIVLHNYSECQPIMRCKLVSGPEVSDEDADGLVQYTLTVRESVAAVEDEPPAEGEPDAALPGEL